MLIKEERGGKRGEICIARMYYYYYFYYYYRCIDGMYHLSIDIRPQMFFLVKDGQEGV